MRISDWSSDVCSSDLLARALLLHGDPDHQHQRERPKHVCQGTLEEDAVGAVRELHGATKVILQQRPQDEAHQEGGPRYLELDHEVADAGEGEGQPHVEEALVIGIGAYPDRTSVV